MYTADQPFAFTLTLPFGQSASTHSRTRYWRLAGEDWNDHGRTVRQGVDFRGRSGILGDPAQTRQRVDTVNVHGA